MSEQTPPDWVLIEAAKRCGREGTKPEVILDRWYSDATLRALCDMIERYEQPPVDRKVLCAREAAAQLDGAMAQLYRDGKYESSGTIQTAVRAIEIYEGGYGND